MHRIVQISSLFFAIFVCCGCQQQLIQEQGVKEEVSASEQSMYQYAGPWDKELFDSLYQRAAQEDIPDIGAIKGSIVPHHLLGGYIDAAVFTYIQKQDPSVIVLIGPNHFDRGYAPIISSMRDWRTPYGDTKAATSLIKQLQKKGIVTIDEEAVKEEHSLYSIIPFITHSLPDAKVLPLMLANNSTTSTLETLVTSLTDILPDDAVIIASIDFSHYQTYAAAEFHDEVSRHVIKTFDYDRLATLEIDSAPSVYTLLRLMEQYGTQTVAHEIRDNSATIVGNKKALNNTSYYSPYFAKGEKASGWAVSLLHVGDIMLDRSVKTQIDTQGGADYLLELLAGEEKRFFRGMDIVTGNLEGPFAKYRRQTSKEIAFHFDQSLISFLQRYHFSVFTTANNHSIDMSREGFAESNAALSEHGIAYYGGDGYSVEDDSLLLYKIHDQTIAFVGVNDTFHSMDEQKVQELLIKGNNEADLVIVSIHWGEEYKPTSNQRQQRLAHMFIDTGADVVIGHHPHVVQEMEIYNGKPIFYSLGNFIFDQYWSLPTQIGLAVGLVMYDTGDISSYLFLVQGKQSQLTHITGKEHTLFFEDFEKKSRIGSTIIQEGIVIP